MPSIVDDDDPVIASHDVYITESPTVHASLLSKLLILQYPSHRPAKKPYNAARSQKPVSLRIKSETGVLEVDVPILTQENYNVHAGDRFGHALAEGQVAKRSGSYGLAGGFSNNPAAVHNLNDIPAHNQSTDEPLHTQTLGGKLVASTELDPVYMLGLLRNGELHLSPVTSVVQMRPQLHHIDAEDEIDKRKAHAAANSKMKQGFEAAVKLETKAIEMKLKSSSEDNKDRSTVTNATLLRKIQVEQWSKHDWIDKSDELSYNKTDQYLLLRSERERRELQSMITNDDWLDKMSAPREDGKKGLRSKLKGRDRERARRKKVEYEKRRLNSSLSNVADIPNLESDSDASELTEPSETELANKPVTTEAVDVKQEPSSTSRPANLPGVLDAVPIATSPPKRRGRPKRVD